MMTRERDGVHCARQAAEQLQRFALGKEPDERARGTLPGCALKEAVDGERCRYLLCPQPLHAVLQSEASAGAFYE